jgi:hypothetical protein
VSALPTFLFLENGLEKHRLVGDSESDLKDTVLSFIAGSGGDQGGDKGMLFILDSTKFLTY